MTIEIPDRADVVVIGGGIAGCATAYYLSQSGASVVLCEKGVIAGEQSSRNWGFIRQQGRHASELPLMIHSLRLWHQLAEKLPVDIGFHVGGTLYFSDDDARLKANLAWLELAKTFELDTCFLTVSQLKKHLPEMSPPNEGALFTPSDARAEPDRATRAIAQQAASNGACILENTAVRGLELSAGAVSRVITESGPIDTSTVVCAGGAWSSYFCRSLNVLFPQLKVIGSVLSTQPGPLVSQSSIWSNGLGMRRRDDGGYSVAYGGILDCEITPDYLRFFRRYLAAYKASKEGIQLKVNQRFMTEWGWPNPISLDRITPFEKERALNPAPNLKLLRLAKQRLGEVFPSLGEIGINRRWAGMIDVTPDELPIISPVAKIPGLILSTGFSGHGFGVGPGVGKVTAELALGHQPSVDLSPFMVERFLK